MIVHGMGSSHALQWGCPAISSGWVEMALRQRALQTAWITIGAKDREG